MTRSVSRGLCFVVVVLAAMFGLAVPAFAAAPTISSFTPTSGPLRTSVKITGSNFSSPATVAFNNVAASSVVVNSSTQITAQVPGSANTGPIKVTTSGGTATSTTNFTVTPGVYLPTTAGPPGTKVSVYFSGFAPYEAVDVYFDSTDLKLVSASSTGSGVATPTVPKTASPDNHFFTAVGRKSGSSAQATFTVRTDWPQFADDGAHTSNNPTESNLDASNVTKLTRTWSAKATTNLYRYSNQVIVAAGLVYAVSGTTGVTALSAATGAVVWSRNVGDVETTPAVSGSLLVVGTVGGNLIGLNAATGAIKYNVAVGLPFYRPITIVNGAAYTDVDDSSFNSTAIAFDVATGATKWSVALNSSCFGVSVSAAERAVYTACNDGTLHVINAGDGSVRFTTSPTTYRYFGVPVIVDGLVISGAYVSGGGSRIVGLDADTGSLVWVAPTTIDLIPNLALSTGNGLVIFRGSDESNNDYYVSALRVATGAAVWSVPDSSGVDAVTIANGLVYATNYTSTDVHDLATGALVTQIRGGQFAVVTDAGVYTGNGYGTAVARYALPSSLVGAATRPAASALRPNRSLRLTS